MQHDCIAVQLVCSNCIAGTALGDPIEVGAATGALRCGSLPLRLTAAKSAYGHAEPAAGTIGIVHAAAQLGAHASAPSLALTAVNPYVIGSLAELRVAGQQAPHVLRQPGAAASLPLPGGAVAQAATGVSAFAVQGTNAHAVLGRRGAAELAAGSNQGGSAWRRQRFWYTAPQHQMLSHCAVGPASSSMAFQSQLSSARLAYICDHQVRAGVCSRGCYQ